MKKILIISLLLVLSSIIVSAQTIQADYPYTLEFPDGRTCIYTNTTVKGSGFGYGCFDNVTQWEQENSGLTFPQNINNLHYYWKGDAFAEFEAQGGDMNLYVEGNKKACYGWQPNNGIHTYNMCAEDDELVIREGFNGKVLWNLTEIQKGNNGGSSSQIIQDNGDYYYLDNKIGGLTNVHSSWYAGSMPHNTMQLNSNVDNALQIASSDAGSVGSVMYYTLAKNKTFNRHIVTNYNPSNSMLEMGYYESNADKENIIVGADVFVQYDPQNKDIIVNGTSFNDLLIRVEALEQQQQKENTLWSNIKDLIITYLN